MVSPPPQQQGVPGTPIPNDGMNQSPDILSTSMRAYEGFRSGPEAYKALPSNVAPTRAPRARFHDPLALMYATGYKDRRFSVSFDTLRRVSYQLALIGAIINTRVSQVAAFAQPYRENKQVGFSINYKDDLYIPSDEERAALRELEMMVLQCGFEQNPYSDYPRDDFEIFLRKIVRDSLTFDQAAFEVIPDRQGRPSEFRAVDASTIRLAATFEGKQEAKKGTFPSRMFTPKWHKLYGDDFALDKASVYTVQVLHGKIENVFTEYDMAFCIRNPRTDIWVNGYGFAEIEMCLNTVLGMLWGEEYNRRFFQQGSAPKGILNIKGDNISPEEMESFRRMWYAQVSGVENAWRTPVIQADGMEYQNLQSTNKEMEFQKWIEYLLKIAASVFGIDPAELNFDIAGGGAGRQPMFEAKHEWKIKHSKDKGLRPLLKSVAKWITKYIVNPLDSRLYLDFVGLDELTEQDRLELQTKKVQHTKTVNEVRAENGDPPVPGGDIILNQTFMQAWQAEQDKKSIEDTLAPWMTTEDVLKPDYGEAPAVPLYLQPKIDLENAGKEEQPEGMEGMEGGDEGGGLPFG
jgi:hypothetical protein